tara:strand:- start:1468 stop:1719 length:252 start_codon:yes stop_codon:yes gene_type:complete
MKKRLEYYGAEWCGPCKMIKPVLKELKSSGMDITFFDIERDVEKAKKLSIMSVPTMVLYRDGDEFERINGTVAKETIKYLMAE